VQNPVLVGALDRPAFDRTQLCLFFRLSVSQSVSQSVCLLTDRLSNDYVHNSLPILIKFCMRRRNVVASSPIVCEIKRKSFADFRAVRIPILAVFKLW